MKNFILGGIAMVAFFMWTTYAYDAGYEEAEKKLKGEESDND